MKAPLSRPHRNQINRQKQERVHNLNDTDQGAGFGRRSKEDGWSGMCSLEISIIDLLAHDGTKDPTFFKQRSVKFDLECLRP